VIDAWLAAAAVKGSASDGPVVAALLSIIAGLGGTLWLFIRNVLKECAYWREAFFAQQKIATEMLITGKVVRGVFAQADTLPPQVGGDKV
jgi:hypothetical protein